VFSVIFRYYFRMSRPPRLPDTAILELIAELRQARGTLTGTQLRAELNTRHGMRGGVTRIYRLLRTATAPTVPASTPTPPPSPASPAAADDTAQLRAELQRALERAELAEYREERHQSRWAGEIHQLREQVHTLREAGHRLPILEQQLQDRSRELAAAYKRISDLEDQLERLSSD
jgi:hypothetical protein